MALQIGKCKACGVLVDFEMRYGKNGWIDPSTNKRLARCPRCDEAISEATDTVLAKTAEDEEEE